MRDRAADQMTADIYPALTKVCVLCYKILVRFAAHTYTGESYNGSITVSKTAHGGSNPSSPADFLTAAARCLCGLQLFYTL